MDKLKNLNCSFFFIDIRPKVRLVKPIVIGISLSFPETIMEGFK